MWRLIVLTSLVLTLAMGTIAEAKCQVCVEGISASKSDSGPYVLRFTARTEHAAAFPLTGTAVVMQVDGKQPQAKCVNVSLRKIDEANGLATYSGTMNLIYLDGSKALTGRVDIGGDIHEFAAPLDGKPGTLQLITAASAGQVASTATSAPTTAPTTAPTSQPETAPAATAAPQALAIKLPSPAEQPALWLGAIAILATAAGAYVDRRRALARVAV